MTAPDNKLQVPCMDEYLNIESAYLKGDMSETMFETVRKLSNGYNHRPLQATIPYFFAKEMGLKRGDKIRWLYHDGEKKHLHLEKYEEEPRCQ